MTATATTPASGHRDVGDTWLLGVEVRADLDPQELVDAVVTVTVTRPDSTTATPAVEQDGPGQYVARYVLAANGRHFAVAAVSGPVVDVVTFAVDALAPTGRPTQSQVESYLGADTVAQWGAATIAEALAAETAAQAKVCRIPAEFDADLSEALKRRVACNLARRPLPLAVVSNDADSGPTVLPGHDPEVKRLEGPYRRVVFG